MQDVEGTELITEEVSAMPEAGKFSLYSHVTESKAHAVWRDWSTTRHS